jgi:antitoxin component of MazEF toxin-antitoxin module
MLTQVQRRGNSLAVCIPKPFALGAGLEQGTPVEIKADLICTLPAPIVAEVLGKLGVLLSPLQV